MKAMLAGTTLAESDDIIECDGYSYFPRAAVRMDRLEPAAKTASDRACPHGVQFYDALIDGVRHERVAWSYEAPRSALRHIAARMSFWEDVEIVEQGREAAAQRAGAPVELGPAERSAGPREQGRGKRSAQRVEAERS